MPIIIRRTSGQRSNLWTLSEYLRLSSRPRTPTVIIVVDNTFAATYYMLLRIAEWHLNYHCWNDNCPKCVCTQSKFLSLELLNRRVRFVWNLGAGSTPIEYPLDIESAEGKPLERDKWYRVVAERFLPPHFCWNDLKNFWAFLLMLVFLLSYYYYCYCMPIIHDSLC